MHYDLRHVTPPFSLPPSRPPHLLSRAQNLSVIHRRAKEAGEEVPAELRVKVAHVNAAVEETFESLHMQMMASAPRLEKFLLAALLLETRFTGVSLSESHPLAMVRPAV